MTTSRLGLALAVSCLVAAPPAFAQRGGSGASSGTASAGSASGGSSGTAVARGGSESSGSGGYGGSSGAGSAGSGRSGAVGGAWSHATAARAAARGESGSATGASAMGSGAAAAAGARQAGAYARGRSAAVATSNAVPRYSRPEPGHPVIGQAVPRGSVQGSANNQYLLTNPYGLYGYYPGSNYGYLYGASMFSPYAFMGDYGFYGGYLGGYGAYDPWDMDASVPYDPYDAGGGTWVATGGSGSSSSSSSDSSLGALRFDVWPLKASVFVDGRNVGLVKQYDSFFKKLRLPAGAHEVELKSDGYEPVAFHVRIEPGKTQVYKGELEKSKH